MHYKLRILPRICLFLDSGVHPESRRSDGRVARCRSIGLASLADWHED